MGTLEQDTGIDPEPPLYCDSTLHILGSHYHCDGLLDHAGNHMNTQALATWGP